MNEDLELALRDSFDARAGAPVDPAALFAAATRRGRRRRWLTYVAGGVGTAAAIVGVAVAAALLPGGGPGITTGGPPSAPSSWSASNPSSWSASDPPTWSASDPPLPIPVDPLEADGPVPALPPAGGVAGAAADPAAVGADPAVLHFGLDPAVARAAYLTWLAEAGAEHVKLGMADRRDYLLTLATGTAALDRARGAAAVRPSQSTTATTVGGKPATLTTAGNGFTLRWQPAKGLWAQVYGTSGALPPVAAAIGAGLRLDKAYRCASPMRLGHVPAGARLTACRVALNGYEHPDANGRPTRTNLSSITVGGNGPASIEVILFPTSPAVADHPAVAGGTGSPSANFNLNAVRTVGGYSVRISGEGYDADTVNAVAAGVTLQGDLRDPGTWPERLIG